MCSLSVGANGGVICKGFPLLPSKMAVNSKMVPKAVISTSNGTSLNTSPRAFVLDSSCSNGLFTGHIILPASVTSLVLREGASSRSHS